MYHSAKNRHKSIAKDGRDRDRGDQAKEGGERFQIFLRRGRQMGE
jgi:hypothetical protein